MTFALKYMYGIIGFGSKIKIIGTPNLCRKFFSGHFNNDLDIFFLGHRSLDRSFVKLFCGHTGHTVRPIVID